MTHATKSGVAHFVFDDEQTVPRAGALPAVVPAVEQPRGPAVLRARRRPAAVAATGSLELIPDSPNKPYDMKKVIAEVVDDGDFFEVNPLWAMNIVCGFARDRRPRRRHRRQPAAGARGHASTSTRRRRRPASCARATRSTSRSSPSSTCPASSRAPNQEYGGIIRHGAKLLYAYCEATVPRVQIITRKGYGGAFVVMNSKSIGADLAFAWPSAEIAVMDANGAVNIIFRREIDDRRRPGRARRPSWSRSTRSGSRTRTTRPSAATSTT